MHRRQRHTGARIALRALSICVLLLGLGAPSTAVETEDPLAVLDEKQAPDSQGAAAADPLDVLTDPGEEAAEDTPTAAAPEPMDIVEAARRVWQRGDIDEALGALRTVLRDNGSRQDALLLLAELQLVRFQGALAETTLRRALDAGAPREQVLLALARALNLQGRQRALLDEVRPADAMDAAIRARLLSERARARLALGESGAAAALLDEARLVDPDVPEPLVGQAVAALRNGFPEQARELLDAALRRAPDHYEAWLLLGELERSVGNLGAAEVAFSEAIARSPNRWMAAYQRALMRLDRGDVDAAESDIALAEFQFPRFLGLAYARARLDLLRGRSAEAVAGFERYLGVQPRDRDALFYAAFAANQLGNREQALDHLDRLQVLEGQSTRLLWLRAKTLMAVGRYGAAGSLLRDAVAVAAPPVELVVLAQEALLRQGRADTALALVQRAIGATPTSRELRAAEARLMLATGDIAAAEAAARQLLDGDEGNVDGLLILAQLAAGRGEDDRDLRVRLRRARQRAPDDPRIPVLLGELHAAVGERQLACAALVEALHIDPSSAPVVGRLQQFRCVAVDPELLQRAYRELLASHPDAARVLPALLAIDPEEVDAEAAVERLRQALSARPADPDLRAELAMALLRAGRAEHAQQALAAGPARQIREPVMLRVRGLVALARDDAAEAVRVFQALADAEPASARALFLLAEAEARLGDLNAARWHFSEGLRRTPTDPLAGVVAARLYGAETSAEGRGRLVEAIHRHAPDSALAETLRAQALIDAGDSAGAADIYLSMHLREPDNRRLLERLIQTLYAAGRREQGIALAEPWMEAHPNDARVALLLADLQAEAGNARRAEHWYRQVLELDPDSLPALNNLAVLRTDTDPKAAVALAEQAYRQAPREPQVMDTYGAALLAAGETARARDLLSQAYSYSGQDPSIGLNLARALVAAGRPERARALLRPLLLKDFPQRVDALALMRELDSP